MDGEEEELGKSPGRCCASSIQALIGAAGASAMPISRVQWLHGPSEYKQSTQTLYILLQQVHIKCIC